MSVTTSPTWPPSPGYDAGYLARGELDGENVPEADIPKWENVFPPNFFSGKVMEVSSRNAGIVHAELKVSLTIHVAFLDEECKEAE